MSSDETALQELEDRSLMTTPVTYVDDEVVVGFDKAKLSLLLGIV